MNSLNAKQNSPSNNPAKHGQIINQINYDYQLASSAKVLANLEKEHESLIKLQKRVIASVGSELASCPPEALDAHFGEFHIQKRLQEVIDEL
jgi:hypothetical protein